MTAPGKRLGAAERRFLNVRRVAYLATADGSGAPHIVPVCFAISGRSAYVAIDEKPKRVTGPALKRMRNIAANPKVALVADRYAEDWSTLAWVMLRGSAHVLKAGAEHARAIGLIRRRYPQTRVMALEVRPVIAIRIRRVASWGRLDVAAGARRCRRLSVGRQGPGHESSSVRRPQGPP